MFVKKPSVLEAIIPQAENINLYRFRFQDGSILDFTPGMFAMLYYKDPQTGEEIGRAYSIASEPGNSYVEFLIELVHGKLTSKLEQAKVGDTYYISAPYGAFKFDASKGKYLFLAGGTGLAPFLSMIKYAIKNKLSADISMIYSVKYPSYILAKDQLESFKNLEAPKVKTTITITRPQPNDNWQGPTGHINEEMVSKYVPDFKERICYICGPLNFVKAMKELMASMGVEEANIKTEMWGEG